LADLQKQEDGGTTAENDGTAAAAEKLGVLIDLRV
jgi:hypothetical protein